MVCCGSIQIDINSQNEGFFMKCRNCSKYLDMCLCCSNLALKNENCSFCRYPASIINSIESKLGLESCSSISKLVYIQTNLVYNLQKIESRLPSWNIWKVQYFKDWNSKAKYLNLMQEIVVWSAKLERRGEKEMKLIKLSLSSSGISIYYIKIFWRQ